MCGRISRKVDSTQNFQAVTWYNGSQGSENKRQKREKMKQTLYAPSEIDDI